MSCMWMVRRSLNCGIWRFQNSCSREPRRWILTPQGRRFLWSSPIRQNEINRRDLLSREHFKNGSINEKLTRLSSSSPAELDQQAEPQVSPQGGNDGSSTEFLANLPSQLEARRNQFLKKISHKLDEIQTYIFTAGKTLNDLTGYSDIEKLKKAIEHQERIVFDARKEVRDAKEAYGSAIANRSASQREVNELLQRKHAWTPEDVERFTALYRSDHANEQAEEQAHARLTKSEHLADDTQAQLGRAILARYHEEQIWSDKIRRASTYGTWFLMGFNVLLFIVVQLGLEPWKRRRLVSSFEEKVHDMVGEDKTLSPNEIQALIRSTIAELGSTSEPVPAPTPIPEPNDAAKVIDETAMPQAETESSQTRRNLSVTSVIDLWNVLKDIIFGLDLNGSHVPNNALYQTTRSELKVWAAASAIAGAALSATLAALLMSL
ncbi:Mdm33 family-domain-containing protein [Lipomyces japonicus]|uniref:Mdm33 family-domain-containing protein n=1 Tax=Lipomyces japonicus TaxID=56871 RepID=UPI0034CF82FD